MRIRRAAGVWVLASGLALGLPLSTPLPAAAAEPALAAARTAPAAAKQGEKPASKPAKPAPKGAARSAAAKPSAKKTATPKRAPRKAGSEPGEPDEATRRSIAGLPAPPGQTVGESSELRAMRAIDLALFPGPGAGAPWPTDDAFRLDPAGPKLQTSGLPPEGELAPTPGAAQPVDLAWLKELVMPDIPVRWDARVVRYLEYYKNDPQGRAAVAIWTKKSGRYGASIRKVLRDSGLPEDVLWLSLVESGMNPLIHSPAGAAGLWQFMPDGGRIYGLTVDRWVDERLDPERSTIAAARYLSDLRQRFGGWELAFAAYNMGYGGLLAAIKKYNTNDYWELGRFEAGIPYETALYVPKIVALAIVGRNRAAFGCDVEPEPALAFDKVSVGSGVSVAAVASASGASVDAITALNPQLIAQRTPPLPPAAKEERSWIVRVPAGSGARAAKGIPTLSRQEGKLDRYAVRWGESLDSVAGRHGTTPSTLQSLNGLRRGEQVRPGTVLFVPKNGAPVTAPGAPPVIVVPATAARFPDKRRVFYRVVAGDTARDVASVLGVTLGDLARWNAIDPAAALHEGMALQAYVPTSATLDDVLVLDEKDATIFAAGSPEFLDHSEALKGRKRVAVTVREGDTFRGIAKRHNLTVGSLERINMRSRSAPLTPGETLVVYVPSPRAAPKAAPPEPGVAVAAAVVDDDDKDDTKADEDEDAETQEGDAPDTGATNSVIPADLTTIQRAPAP